MGLRPMLPTEGEVPYRNRDRAGPPTVAGFRSSPLLGGQRAVVCRSLRSPYGKTQVLITVALWLTSVRLQPHLESPGCSTPLAGPTVPIGELSAAGTEPRRLDHR